MSKYLHKIIINNEISDNVFKYDYSTTKDIILSISKESISISVYLSRIHDKEEMLNKPTKMIKDAIRKALLVHLILYSKKIKVNDVIIQIDNEIYKNNSFPIIYFFDDEVNLKIKKNWLKKEINGLLKINISDSDSRLAALTAFIISKSKTNEQEKFIYLWMAFNGMYGFLNQKFAEINHVRKNSKEFIEIGFMQQFLEVGAETIGNRKVSKSMFQKTINILKKYPNEIITKDSLENGIHMRIASKINNNLKNYNLNAYGYLLTQFSYYIRCNLIHANKPISLFSYLEDDQIGYFKIANNLLEEFLDNNLNKWFNNEYVSKNIIPKVKKMIVIKNNNTLHMTK